MFESTGSPPWPPEPVETPVEPDTLDDLTEVPTEELEARVCTLAGHLAAATCRWLVLLGEYDARAGWAGPGMHSCAQWLSWRCGLSMPAARAHVRVARALRGLPRLCAVFAAGRVSYSKVRSIVRVATPDLEEQLVDLALACTAAQLDAIVASYRKTKNLQGRPYGGPARTTSWDWDEDGYLVVRSRLAPEEGALYLAAVEAMRPHLDSLDDSGDPAGSPRDGTQDCGEDETAQAYRCSKTDAVVAMAATALAAGPVDTSGTDRFEVVIHADLDQLLGDPDTAEPTHEPGTRDRRGSLTRGRCHIRGGPCLHPATLHRLACDAAIRVMVHGQDGSPKDTGRRTRLTTASTRRLLEDRDGGRCRFPACGHTRFLHAHHVVHWAHGGPTDLDNLVLLCSHHHRLLHELGYSITTDHPGQFGFHRPDGALIYPAPAQAGKHLLDQLPTQVHNPPAITQNTTTPYWAGERCDVGYIVSLLFPPEPLAATA